MAFGFITSGTAFSSAGAGSPSVTSALNTSGANFIVIVSSDDAFDPLNDTVQDNKFNTWLFAVSVTEVNGTGVGIWYAENAIVGSNHIFTVTGNYNSIVVSAFSGGLTLNSLDQKNSHSRATNDVTIQAGSVTPAQDNELLIAGISSGGTPAESVSIDSGYNEIQQTAQSGLSLLVAQGWLIQTSLAASNPTWTSNQSRDMSAVIATFKAAPAGGGVTPQRALIGVGT